VGIPRFLLCCIVRNKTVKNNSGHCLFFTSNYSYLLSYAGKTSGSAAKCKSHSPGRVELGFDVMKGTEYFVSL
jgi:hypothetical protein